MWIKQINKYHDIHRIPDSEDKFIKRIRYNRYKKGVTCYEPLVFCML